ncbi:MAG: flagellar brake protein [Halopseudomonas sp.]
MAVKRLQHQSSDQQLQGVKEQLQFDDLKLIVGERVRLETVSPRGRFSVRYLGAHVGRCLMVTMPLVNGVVKPVKEGTSMTLRLIALNRACAFKTRMIKAQTSPVPMLFLDYPDSVEAVLVRKAARVNSQLIVSVDEVESGHFGSGWPRQALCCDISLHGARIEASDQLGELGDGLFITARVSVGEVDQVLMLEGKIRNLEEVEDSFNDGFRMVHGLEFVGLDEETQLILTGFVYQQMLREQVGL